MMKKWIASSMLFMISLKSASAHEGHVEHHLFGDVHAHVGWEHMVTMALIIALALLVRKR